MHSASNTLRRSGAGQRLSAQAALSRLWTVVLRAAGRHRQRQLLAEMPAHLLKDIGVTRAEALQEASKPFWVR
jgi:uncharacterized protein YjiS (DUF1127 family)